MHLDTPVSFFQKLKFFPQMSHAKVECLLAKQLASLEVPTAEAATKRGPLVRWALSGALHT